MTATTFPVHYHADKPARFTRVQLFVRIVGIMVVGMLGLSFGVVYLAAYLALPAFAAAAAGPVDQSIVIQAGAIQIHAVRVDEEVVRRIDFELAKLIRRRQERR